MAETPQFSRPVHRAGGSGEKFSENRADKDFGKRIPPDYSLEATQSSVLFNVGSHVPQLSADDFFATFLPKTHINPKDAKAIHARVLRVSYKHGRWKSFPLDPNANTSSEEEAFQGLVDIADAVFEAALHCVPQIRAQTGFNNTSESPSKANTRPNKTRPDGCFVRAGAKSTVPENPHWIDIAATGEYNKNGTSLKQLTDNVHKTLWDMHRTMREDASRRFTYAFTIENCTMRVWFASRSEILVSESFDFMEDPKRLVDFFLAFTFAPKEELGWDPTMKCRWNGIVGNPFQYDITVRHMDTGENTVYQTQKLLSDVGANHIRGRGTRVWKVKKVSEDGRVGETEFILKDSWVDCSRQREGKVLADIRASAKDATALAQLDKILLTMSIHGDVYIDDTVDQTISGDYRDAIIGDNRITFALNHISPNATATGSSGEELNDQKKGKAVVIVIDDPVGDSCDRPPAEVPQEEIEPTYYSSKVHYRIVFEEVCVPLHNITSLRYYVYMLFKATRALGILHSVGWVHRDISAGNILLFGTQIKLADLEYAKPMTSTEPARDIRTGTVAFMAVEVEEQGYCFAPGACIGRVTGRSTVSTEKAADEVVIGEPREASVAMWELPRDVVKEGWRYNPLHDMESIEWLLARSLLYHDHYLERVQHLPITRFSFKWGTDTVDPFAKEAAEERIGRTKAHYIFGRALFVTRTERYKAMYRSGYLNSRLKAAPLFPGVIPLGQLLTNMQAKLVEEYQKSELDIAAIDHTCAKELTLYFIQQLHAGYEYLQDVANCGYEIMIRPLQGKFAMCLQQDREPCSAGTKRVNDEDDDDRHDPVSRPPKCLRTETKGSPVQSRVAGPSLLPVTPPTAAVAVLATTPVVTETNELDGRRTAGVSSTTRTLRSHVRLAACPESPSLEPPARLARTRKSAFRTGKTTKDDETLLARAKSTAKIQTRKRC